MGPDHHDWAEAMNHIELRLLSGEEMERYRSNVALAGKSADAKRRDAARRELERIAALPDEALIEIQFRDRNLTRSERRLIEIVDHNPGATSAALTRALGWRAQSWHLHFGIMCHKRLASVIAPPHFDNLPKADGTPGDFYSGILCEFDAATSGFTLRSHARRALVAAGVLATDRSGSGAATGDKGQPLE
jgi:hypothetical protein